MLVTIDLRDLTEGNLKFVCSGPCRGEWGMHLDTLLPLGHLPRRLFATTGQLDIVDLFVMLGSPCSRIAAQRPRDGGRGRRLEIIGPDSIRPSQPRPGEPEGNPSGVAPLVVVGPGP